MSSYNEDKRTNSLAFFPGDLLSYVFLTQRLLWFCCWRRGRGNWRISLNKRWNVGGGFPNWSRKKTWMLFLGMLIFHHRWAQHNPSCSTAVTVSGRCDTFPHVSWGVCSEINSLLKDHMVLPGRRREYRVLSSRPWACLLECDTCVDSVHMLLSHYSCMWHISSCFARSVF